jgi:hypothetical protein
MKLKLTPIVIIVFIVWTACNTTTNQKKEIVTTDSIDENNDSVSASPSQKIEMVISDISFPFEIFDKLYVNHIPFSLQVMNSVGNNSKYNQYNSKALNLGIYGADLSYAVTYEEFQQMGTYLKITKQLAEELNIPYAFDQAMMDNYSKFKDNKDSLKKMVFNSYNQVDQGLKNNERIGMAALVVAGSWLEGLYVSTKTFLDVPKTEQNIGMYTVIADQKKSLGIVIKLLSEYKNDPYINNLINELTNITSDYNQITSNITMNEKQLILIQAKVKKLRMRIVEGL